MSFLRRKSDESSAAAVPTVEVPQVPTNGKGRPTPKRRVAEGRRGPVAPPPLTQREAIKRSKTAGQSLTKEERKVLAAERREKMMRGDDASMLPRDRGAVRAYVRDLIDARRNIAGLLLPIALLSFFILLIPKVPLLQVYGPLVLLIAIFGAVIDSLIFGRQMNRKVAAKFPKGDSSGLSTRSGSLTFYGFNRACLPRRWRVPRPRVQRGETIS